MRWSSEQWCPKFLFLSPGVMFYLHFWSDVPPKLITPKRWSRYTTNEIVQRPSDLFERWIDTASRQRDMPQSTEALLVSMQLCGNP